MDRQHFLAVAERLKSTKPPVGLLPNESLDQRDARVSQWYKDCVAIADAFDNVEAYDKTFLSFNRVDFLTACGFSK